MEENGIKLPAIGSKVGLAGMTQSQMQVNQDQLNQPQSNVGLGMPTSSVGAPAQPQGLAASGLPQQGNQPNGYQILGAPRII